MNAEERRRSDIKHQLNLLGYLALRGVRTPAQDAEAAELLKKLHEEEER